MSYARDLPEAKASQKRKVSPPGSGDWQLLPSNVWQFLASAEATRLEAIEPVNFVHYTEDGMIFSRVTRLRTGKVMARHWGKELDGGKVFRRVSAGKKYLSDSFSHMFPEHECDGRCGPTQEPANPK